MKVCVNALKFVLLRSKFSPVSQVSTNVFEK